MRTTLAAAFLLWAPVHGASTSEPFPPVDLVVIIDQARGTHLGPSMPRSLPSELQLRPQDRIALIELKGEPRIKEPLASDSIHLPQEKPVRVGGLWSRPQRGSGGRIYDALIQACGVFPQPPEASRVRAILLISEDRERGSKADEAQVLASLQRSKASLFLLRDSVRLPRPEWQVSPPALPPVSYPQTESVEPLVTETGGETAASDKRSLHAMIRAIQERLAHANLPQN